MIFFWNVYKNDRIATYLDRQILNFLTWLFIPPANKVWGFIGITIFVCPPFRLSECPSVCANSYPDHIFVYGETLKVISLNMCTLLMTWRRVMPLTKLMSGQFPFYGETLEFLTSHIYCLWTEGVSWTWPHVILVSSRKCSYSCLLHTVLMEKHLQCLFQIGIVYDEMMCHEYLPKVNMQVQLLLLKMQWDISYNGKS